MNETVTLTYACGHSHSVTVEQRNVESSRALCAAIVCRACLLGVSVYRSETLGQYVTIPED